MTVTTPDNSLFGKSNISTREDSDEGERSDSPNLKKINSFSSSFNYCHRLSSKKDPIPVTPFLLHLLLLLFCFLFLVLLFYFLLWYPMVTNQYLLNGYNYTETTSNILHVFPNYVHQPSSFARNKYCC